MLLVRERPPLRLSVDVKAPSGVRGRWGADDPNPANQPQALTFGTAMPGGFNDMSCTLQRDPKLTYPDIEELADVTVRGLGGGQIAWQGRLEQLPDTGGAQAQLSPQCVGYQSELDDDSSAAMIYVDQSLTAWQGPPLARQISLAGGSYQLASNSVAADPANNQPVIVMEIDDSWVSPYQPLAEIWYDAGVAGPIAQIYYDIDFNNGGDPKWLEALFLSADDAGISTVSSGNLASGGAVAGYFAPGALTRWALVEHGYSSTPAGADGAAYKAYWRLAVYGHHGLPLYGSDPKGVLASDVVAHALRTWAPKLAFTTGPGGTIQASVFIIPQLAFPTPGTSSTIVKQAVQYELLDFAVWEGPTFYLNARGASTTSRNWRARVGDCQLQDTGPNVSRVWNGVVVQFSNVDGTTGTVGPPGSTALTTDASLLDSDPQNPANQAGLRRWTLLQMGTTTPTGAIQVGARFLQEQKLLDTSGQASLVGHVQDDHGVWWPAWMARAGDTLTVVDAKDTSARRIVNTSYDDTSKTNSLQLDQPPDSLDALLDRLSAVIQPLGLT